MNIFHKHKVEWLARQLIEKIKKILKPDDVPTCKTPSLLKGFFAFKG